jgi:hypothetical protein
MLACSVVHVRRQLHEETDMTAARLRRLALLCVGALVLQAIGSAVANRDPSASVTGVILLVLLAPVFLWFHALAGEDRGSGEALGQKSTAVAAERDKPPQLPFWWQDMKRRGAPHLAGRKTR